MTQNTRPALSDLTPEQREQLLQRLRDKNVARTKDTQIVRTMRGDIVPASFAQQRLWFLNQLDPTDPSYNWPASVRFRGRLRVDILEQSLSEVIRRHEVLRTAFGIVEGNPVQRILPHSPFSLP